METRGRKHNDGRGRLGGREAGTPNREYRAAVSYLRADRPELRGRRRADGRGRLGGRAKGTKNERTDLFYDMMDDFRDGNFKKAVKLWESIKDPATAIRLYIKIAKLVTPTPTSTRHITYPERESCSDELRRLHEEFLASCSTAP